MMKSERGRWGRVSSLEIIVHYMHEHEIFKHFCLCTCWLFPGFFLSSDFLVGDEAEKVFFSE